MPDIVANRPAAYTSPANVTGGHREAVPREILSFLRLQPQTTGAVILIIYALAVLLGPHIYISRGVVHLVSSGENANWPLQLRTCPVEWPQVRPTPYHVLATGQMQLFAEKYNAGIGIW